MGYGSVGKTAAVQIRQTRAVTLKDPAAARYTDGAGELLVAADLSLARREINKVLGRTARAAVRDLHHARDVSSGGRPPRTVSAGDCARDFVAGH